MWEDPAGYLIYNYRSAVKFRYSLFFLSQCAGPLKKQLMWSRTLPLAAAHDELPYWSGVDCDWLLQPGRGLSLALVLSREVADWHGKLSAIENDGYTSGTKVQSSSISCQTLCETCLLFSFISTDRTLCLFTLLITCSVESYSICEHFQYGFYETLHICT